MLRVMKTAEVSVFVTSTSISPNVFFSLSQYTELLSCQQEERQENKSVYNVRALRMCIYAGLQVHVLTLSASLQSESMTTVHAFFW